MNILKYCLLPLIILLSGIRAEATLALPGEWTAVPTFAYPLQNIEETPSKVYYLAGGGLFSYDKDADESYAYTIDNKLTETDIKLIKYNSERKYLLIAYVSGSIDLLYDDGTVVSLPEIADATELDSHVINQVAFEGKYIYVATGFGVVKFDESRHEVVESGIYNFNVPCLTISDGYLVIGHDNYLWTLPVEKNLRSFSSFSQLAYVSLPTELATMPDGTVISRGNWPDYSSLVAFKADFAANRVLKTNNVNPKHTLVNQMITTDDALYYVTEWNLYKLDNGAWVPEHVMELPQDYRYNIFSIASGLESVWALSLEGLSHVKFDTAGGVTVLSDRAYPADALSVKRVCFFIPSADGSKLYIMSDGSSPNRFGGSNTDLLYYPQMTSVLELDEFGKMEKTEVYPMEVSEEDLKSYQYKNGPYAVGTHNLAEDPDEPDTYYLSTPRDGVLKVRGREFIGRYNYDNSPLPALWGCISYNVSIDPGGNLWVFTESTDEHSGIIVLPASKRKLNPSEVKKSDWVCMNFPDLKSDQSVCILHCKHSNMIFAVDAGNKNILLAYDTKGTYDNFADDKYYVWTSYTDQDGKSIVPTYNLSLAEDKNGYVWIGTGNGVFTINDPSKATDPSMTVTHVKVPRNDGTNSADYLLSSDIVQGIAVDAANRKWIATQISGLYLVSSDGSSILRNFNSQNSPLPEDEVYAVYANPYNTDVYVGTRSGMFVYGGDTSAPAEDYSDIYAYPNPVRPEYSGSIYVKGLVDNSLVKIADASGNVLSQGRAEGGMYIWDGCDMGGVRVRSGVYYIYASAADDSGSSQGAVAKVMVIN
ncbi:MAG: hypothetical protein NC043_08435 [Muribaculaceae bacterium]|nr:hypothetical protein [Muribaculaceae bacterium]